MKHQTDNQSLIDTQDNAQRMATSSELTYQEALTTLEKRRPGETIEPMVKPAAVKPISSRNSSGKRTATRKIRKRFNLWDETDYADFPPSIICNCYILGAVFQHPRATKVLMSQSWLTIEDVQGALDYVCNAEIFADFAGPNQRGIIDDGVVKYLAVMWAPRSSARRRQRVVKCLGQILQAALKGMQGHGGLRCAAGNIVVLLSAAIAHLTAAIGGVEADMKEEPTAAMHQNSAADLAGKEPADA